MNLSNRLKMTADLVRGGKVVADIGTDHAYLPTYLVLNKIIPSALACDLRVGPLENAKETVKQYGLSDKIELRLSDGLNNIYKDEVDDVVIAGMGGTLITEIISRADWLKNPDKHLVLQPQSHAEEVREYLCENGFEIEKETATNEGERLYIAISAYFTGKKIKMPLSFYHFGLLQQNDDEISKQYLEKTIQRLKNKKKALVDANKPHSEIEEILKEE